MLDNTTFKKLEDNLNTYEKNETLRLNKSDRFNKTYIDDLIIRLETLETKPDPPKVNRTNYLSNDQSNPSPTTQRDITRNLQTRDYSPNWPTRSWRYHEPWNQANLRWNRQHQNWIPSQTYWNNRNNLSDPNKFENTNQAFRPSTPIPRNPNFYNRRPFQPYRQNQNYPYRLPQYNNYRNKDYPYRSESYTNQQQPNSHLQNEYRPQRYQDNRSNNKRSSYPSQTNNNERPQVPSNSPKRNTQD